MSSQEVAKQKLRELLFSHGATPNAKEIAETVCERAFWMHHLYVDMGFASRVEMNRFMCEHFPELGAKRPPDIRWKKYLFDCIGELAPACTACKDMTNCFVCDILELAVAV